MPVQLKTAITPRQDGDVYIVIRDGKPANILVNGDGRSVLNGTVNPTIDDGEIGDFWINTVSHYIFGPKVFGGWGVGVALVGAAGTNGTNGTNGFTWFSNGTVPLVGDGVNGDHHLNTSTGDVYKKQSGTWSIVANITGPAGTNGTNGANGTSFPAKTISTKTAGYTAVNGDFAGNVLLKMNLGTALTLTINTGLTGVEPLNVMQYGAGQVTIAGTATFRYAVGLKTRSQYSIVSIIPIGTNEYLVLGDAAP